MPRIRSTATESRGHSCRPWHFRYYNPSYRCPIVPRRRRRFLAGTTVRWIPAALITTAAYSLARALRAACDAPDSTIAWTALITWAMRRLLAPEGRLGRAAMRGLLCEQLAGVGAPRRAG